MLYLSHKPYQVAGIVLVWQHFLDTVLLEVEVTILLSAQKHECQQCRLD